MKLFLILCALWLICSGKAAETLTLRGYGKISADFCPERVSFVCESQAKAEIVYAKLYRDLTQMGARPPRSAVRKGVPVLLLESGKAGVIGMGKGNSVVFLEASSPKELLARKEIAELDFPERKPYPVFYDYYDLRAMKFYKTPMSSALKYGLEKHWPFAKKHKIEGFVLHTNFSFERTPAQGILNFTAADYELRKAKEADGLVTFCAGFGGGLPLWFYNWKPENCARVQRSTVVSEWQHGVEAGSYESYGESLDPEHSPLRAFQKTVMEKYRNHPNLGGWQLYCGAPIGDQLGMGMGGVLWDSSDGARKAFRQWLKKKYTLKELGTRWKGDPNAYSSWDQVEFLQLMDIIGGDYDMDRLLLSNREWLWRVTPKDGYGKLPPDNDKWLPIHFPPSQRCNYVDVGSGYYKLKLDNPEWLKGRTGKTLYLKAAVTMWDSSRLHGWFNGQFLKGEPVGSSGTKMTEIVLPPGTLRGDGSDEILLQTPAGRHRGDGRIHGPISLSERPAENFPYADSRINARFYDAKMFQIDSLIRRNLAMYSLARKIDPDRPLSISGADVSILSALAPFCGEQGISMQSTSIDAFFYPTLSSWGSLYGFYFTGESSQPIAKPTFDAVMGRTFYQGTSATAIFMDIEQYMKFEEETGKMSQRAPLLRHFGKYLPEPAQIGLLNTSQTYLLGGLGPWNWALGRGELPSAHFPCCMITEKELINRIAFRFPVILDSSDIMTEETVSAILKYVENGGTFLALPFSGQHSVLKQNAQLLSGISGFCYDARMRGSIRFTDSQNVFPEWKGKTLNGDGNALDWKSIQGSFGVRLIPCRLDVEVLAHWKDGSPAIGVRNLGKGRIITLGSPFFRNGRDTGRIWLPDRYNHVLESLFSQLGVKRSVTADTERVWLRKAVTKNGLEDWILASNVSVGENPEVTANIRLAPSGSIPSGVYDAVTGKRVAFRVEKDGTVLLPDLKFGKDETRIFALPRSIPVSSALKTWWGEKEKYWKKGREEKVVPVKHAVPAAISIADWWFLPGNGYTKGTSWMTDPVSAAKWRKIPYGTWTLSASGLTSPGIGFYRQEFEIPADWKGHRIYLQFNTRNAIQEKAVFHLNGREIFTFDLKKQHRELHGIFSKEITPYLKNGRNILALKVASTNPELAGICDSIWFVKERKLSETVSLDGEWECVKGDLLTSVPTILPGTVKGRFLRRKFLAPSSWKGKRIFLRLETPRINISSVMLNERAKGLNGAFPPFGQMVEINVSELVIPGRENSIELWHRHTIPTNWIGVAFRWPKESTISVDHVTIGIEDEK